MTFPSSSVYGKHLKSNRKKTYSPRKSDSKILFRFCFDRNYIFFLSGCFIRLAGCF